MNKEGYISLLVLLVFSVFFDGCKGKYAKYYEAAIHGKIENIRQFKKDYSFSVSGEQFSITPNKGSVIDYIENGYCVSKKANNHTLIVSHEDEIFYIIAQRKQ